MSNKRFIWMIALLCAALTTWALPTEVKNKDFFESIKYKWPYNAAPADQTESNLAQIATDPDQIIAMLREVYRNTTIPGNYVRGYDANGNPEGTWDLTSGSPVPVAVGNYPVAYPAIGILGETNGSYGYIDAYGWGLDGDFYNTSKITRTVTFDASVEDDCSTTGSKVKDGFKISTSDLSYHISTHYYVANANKNLHIESLNGYEITQVAITCSSSSYVANFNGSTPSGKYSSNGAVRTWVGSAIDLTLKNPNYRVQISKVVVTYQVPGNKIKYTSGSYKAISGYTTGTKSFIAGTDASQGSKTINGTSQNYNTKAPITIGCYNLNRSLGYTLDTKGINVICDDGYVISRVKLTFDGLSSLNKISNVTYNARETVTINNESNPTISSFINTSTLTFDFNIPATSINISPKTTYSYVTRVDVEYKYLGSFDGFLAPNMYVPEKEGNTVLMLEMKDGVSIKTLINGNLAVGTVTVKVVNGISTETIKFDEYAVTDYASLRALVAATIKSARVLTGSKRVGANSSNPGTLFKIDCDKLNRFFLLGKGQLRWFDNDHKSNSVTSDPAHHWSFYNNYQPYHNSFYYYDQSVEALFGHMFEQFSPSLASGGSSLNDIYRLLVNGESFDVKHDCIDVISAESKGHEFNMYGKTSISDDCQDVRDMMFFVPDYRMTAFTHPNVAKWSRDPNQAQKYLYYDSIHGHAPTLGLYTIKLDSIEQVEKVAGEDAYNVTLNWNSNLLKFLPGEQGKYTLYRVTVGTDGVERYTVLKDADGNDVVITTSDASELTYVDKVQQTGGSQIVTYAVRGQDQEGFLTLQMSNKESAYIPGTDTSEQLQLQLGADYYSRFDPQAVKNNYSNLVKLGNSQVTKILPDYLTTDGTEQFTFTRGYTDANGDIVTTTFATAHVATKANNAGTLVVTMQNQEHFKYGYQSNGNNATATNPNGSTFTLPFTYDATGVNFSSVALYDNFSVLVDNNHPGEYFYQVRFDYQDNGEPMYAYSNKMSVYVQKTDMTMNSYTKQQVDNDTVRGLPADVVDFDIQVKYSSKKDILRYDAYRWEDGATRYIIEPSSSVTNEQDVPPTGIAGNQGETYSVAMNTGEYLYTGESGTWVDGLANANFKDYMAGANAGKYVYVPVVELFPPRESRSDYNTYGAPLRNVSTADVELQLAETPEKSEYTWTDEHDNVYAYYLVKPSMLARGSSLSLIPDGYELYKVRTWRQIDPQYLGEQLGNRQSRISGDYLVEELTYPDVLANGPVVENDETPHPTTLCVSPTTFSNPGRDEVSGTFGALDVVEYGMTIPVKFIVRAYYTLSENLTTSASGSGAPRRAASLVQVADGAEFFVTEQEFTTNLDGVNEDAIVTAVSGVQVDRHVAGVTYYNLMGMPSTRPVPGINIKVTRYSDGTQTTSKIIF